MANKKLLRRIAPLVMSVAVAMSSMPAAAFAADFTDEENSFAAESTYEETAPEESYEEDGILAEEDGFGSEDTCTTETDGFGAVEDTEDVFQSEDVIEQEAEEPAANEEGLENVEYVMMNIPYDAFYKSELKNNDVHVDAFTSATLNKSRTAGMMNGNSAYHTDTAGTNLAGVTFPVRITDPSVLQSLKQVKDEDSVTITVTNRGQTSQNTYTGEKALIENDNYAFYVLKDAPSYYKELQVDGEGNITFGAVQGMSQTTVSVSSKFMTETTYGDYELDLDDAAFQEAAKGGVIDPSTDNIYGVVVNTTDGTTYGLRHLENIWRGGHLSWGTGFTESVHGCPVSSEHYKSMMGKTISSVTYYTNKGIINFDIEDTYVPVKTGVSVTAENVKTADKTLKVEFSKSLPDDFAVKYAVDGVETGTVEGLVSIESLTPGKHTVTVSDGNGKYAPVSAEFVAETDVAAAAYDEYGGKLVAAVDVTAEQFAAYTKAITKVKVGEKEYAASGRGSVQIVKEDGSLDLSKVANVEGAEITVVAAGYPNLTFTYSQNVYVYAGLTWAEYWANEAVYNAGSATSSDEKDRRNESDLGAFDAVTRATANHGLHRGSFQSIAVLNGKTISYWSKDGKTVYYADGTSEAFNRNNVKSYQILGLKYVPVQISRADLSDFAAAHAIVKNGGQLIGGYGEGQLKSYEAVANVTANTNGLKVVTRNEDGSFNISARKSGTDSGIKGAELKEATGIEPKVREGAGTYGEFLRVDLNGNYGDLGSHLQSVEWTYYGNDSSYTNKLANYGTKFAADNWMHKSMGIQLGLTLSQRFQLPEGYDGTGYWTITVHALGYKDYVYSFQATEANLARSAGDADSTPLENIIAEAKALKEADYTPESWAAAKDNIAMELEECEEMLANIKNQTKSGVEEQIGHLRAAMNALVKATPTVKPETSLTATAANTTLYVGGATGNTTTITVAKSGIEEAAQFTSSNPAVAAVDQNGTVTAKKAGTTVITVTAGGLTANVNITVANAGITVKAQAKTIYTGGKKTTTINVTKNGVTGKAKFTSSNKKVATVNAKGVVTAKKAGKTVITVKAGKFTKKVTITVKKPSLKLVKASASIKKGKTVAIRVKATPAGKATYKSSNKKVATVSSNGVVKGKKKGTAVITVTCNGLKAKFKVTVK